MVRIGRFEFGWLAFSVLVVFVVLTGCVTYVSFDMSASGVYVREVSGSGFWYYWLWFETMALVFTLMYGVITHFVFVIFSRINKKQ